MSPLGVMMRNLFPSRPSRVETGGIAAMTAVALLALAVYEQQAHGMTGRAGPANNGGITFTRDGPEGDGGVFLFKGPGNKPKALWQCRCYEFTGLNWATDGIHLAFATTTLRGSPDTTGLHIVNVVTREDRLVCVQGDCGGEFAPAWSADGKQVAVVVTSNWPSPSGRIVLMRSDGSHQRTLHTGEGPASSPSFSRDGTTIVFSRARDKHPPAVYTINLHTGTRKLVSTAASDPAWSPDGKLIAVSRCNGIALLTPHGANMTPGTAGSNSCRTIGRGGRPVWSPDGTKIMTNVGRKIYVVGADGSNPHNVTTTLKPIFWNGRLAWRPAS